MVEWWRYNPGIPIQAKTLTALKAILKDQSLTKEAIGQELRNRQLDHDSQSIYAHLLELRKAGSVEVSTATGLYRLVKKKKAGTVT